MKKLIALILVLTLAAGVLAGCGGNTTETTAAPTEPVTEPETEAPETAETAGETEAVTADLGRSNDALAILESIWADYAEEEKFPVSGGDFDAGTFNMGAPGAFDMTRADALMNTLLLSQDRLAQADGAATLMHGMNANVFTGGLLHMTEGADLTAFADEIRESIRNNQWLCGAPETMLLATIDGEYLLISFGNAEIMDIFQGHLESVVPQTEILYNEAIFE